MGEVKIVNKSRKEYKCSKCGKVIPVGSRYYRGIRFRKAAIIAFTNDLTATTIFLVACSTITAFCLATALTLFDVIADIFFAFYIFSFLSYF